MKLEISCKDRLGIAQDVLDILVEHQIDLRGIEIDEQGKIFLNFPNIEFADFQHLMPKIRLLDGIEDVKTTTVLPTEREQYQLQALLQTLPDPVLSIDTKGKVTLVNDVVVEQLARSKEDILGADISELVKSFSLQWCTDNEHKEFKKVRFLDQDYLLDILPVKVPSTDQEKVLAGAVLLFKSEYRLGQQLTFFQKDNANSFAAFQTNNMHMKQVLREVKKFAELEASILIVGGSGTGKTLLANACHKGSARAAKPFYTINCIGLTEQELHCKLFGELDETLKSGLLSKANHGTLLIEEVADLPLNLQAKLLNALETITPSSPEHCTTNNLDVRLICTTEKNLQNLISEGKFRQDLYYRLSQLNVVLPPLRNRTSDISLLVDYFVNKQCLKMGRARPFISQASIDYLQSYPWPGNVRQLENHINSAVSILQTDELSKENLVLPDCSEITFLPNDFEGSLDEELKRIEKGILQSLYPSFPSTRLLAKKLGLSHTAIANKLREYEISKK